MAEHSNRTIALRGFVAALIAVAANAVVVAAADAAAVGPDFRALTYPPVVFLTIVGVVGASIVYWYLQNNSRTPDRTFTRIAAAVLVVSFVPDLGLLFADPAATVAGVLLLMAMHVVVAAVSVFVLTRGLVGAA